MGSQDILEDYKVDKIAFLKKRDPRLYEISDVAIARLYSEWSEYQHAAGWYGGEDAAVVSEFLGWCFGTPFESAGGRFE